MEYILDAQKSTAAFVAYAPMHSFKGWVEKGGLKGRLAFDPEKGVLKAIEAAADTGSFETGDADRNKAMDDFFHLKDHPETSFLMTEVKSQKAGAGGKQTVSLVGILEFAGIRRQLPINCTIMVNDGTISFDLTFKWSFKAFGLKAPRLLFLTVRDIVDIKAHLEFTKDEGRS